MSDLKIGKIPLEDITLEKMNAHNDKHIKAIGSMRDSTAIEMCYDIYDNIESEKRDTLMGNPFLVKNNDQYVGYMYISDEYDGERILAYIVEETVRGRGLGKVMLTSVSNYLFEFCNTSTIKLYINKDNVAGVRLAVACGFERTNVSDGILCGYDRKK